jgi:hypothetical protein
MRNKRLQEVLDSTPPEVTKRVREYANSIVMEWKEFAAKLREAGWPEDEIEAEITKTKNGYYDE